MTSYPPVPPEIGSRAHDVHGQACKALRPLSALIRRPVYHLAKLSLAHIAGRTWITPTHQDTYPAIDSAIRSDLRGRAVLITGASKGIGYATSISYAKAGASQIAIAARSSFGGLEREMTEAARAAGHSTPQILALKLDVQDRATITAAAEEMKRAFGKLDILINNAGVIETFRPVATSDEDEYWKTWEVNYRGVYWVSKTFLPLLLGTEGGLKTLINMSSIGALILGPTGSSYETSKYALLRFTEYLMVENAGDGLLAYCVHPGAISSELGRRLPEKMHHILTDQPALTGDTLAFLTQEKRDWLAGRYVSCTWDMPVLLSRQKEIVDGDKLKMRMVF
ncbi:MAG: hypothetical protein M1818_007458 [Claussenomyces sp. TS43310]|nr:MAG: hypothetical protein M1818_007458 [Claussenomyces sp. TS43310]